MIKCLFLGHKKENIESNKTDHDYTDIRTENVSIV